MTIMTATAVGLFRESFFCRAATTMLVPRTRNLFTRKRVNVDRAEFLATFPAPRSATASANRKGAPRL